MVAQDLITTAAEIRNMDRETARRALPVRVRGVVTFSELQGGTTYVQDLTGGVYVRLRPPGESRRGEPALEPGTHVEIDGVTAAGIMVAFVSHPPDGAISVRRLGRAPLPEPLRPPRDRLLDPRLHNQWVELDALVSGAHGSGRLELDLLAGGRRFRATVTRADAALGLAARLPGSGVRVRGVYRALIDASRQMVGFRLSVPSPAFVAVQDEALDAAFARPPVGVDEIMKFEADFSERARVRGVVLAATSREFVLRAQGGALWVRPARTETLQPGQQVDVVGVPELARDRTTLVDAVVRTTGEISALEPLSLRDSELDDIRLDGELVRLEARLIGQLQRDDSGLLLLRGDRGSLYARSMPGLAVRFKRLPANSWIEITGICAPEPPTASLLEATREIPGDAPQGVVERPRTAARFHLLVRSAEDVRVLKAPPWWTPERIALATGLAGLVVVGVLVWNFTLRRRVARQTAVIARRIEQDRIYDERQRIARELHDTLEQHLAGIHLLARTAALQAAEGSDRLHSSLNTLSALAQHSQEEARRSVWDLRMPGEAQWDLAHGLGMLAAAIPDGGDKPQVTVEVAGSAPALSATVEHHLLRIAQEAVNNAIKHGGARHIRLALVFRLERIELEIQDDGCGFDPAIFDAPIPGHFGVRGMHERAGKIGAALEIVSEPQRGTTVRVIAPLVASKRAPDV
jgi:signal transduction histidine kinase